MNSSAEEEYKDGIEFEDSSSPSSQSEQIASLQDDLNREKDRRREDWFFAIIIVVIALDVWAFSIMSNWGGPVMMGVLELFLLVLIANRFGIEEVSVLLNKVLNRFNS